jgi:hypothetical protein
MATDIKCPNCGHNFTLDDVMSDELNTKLKAEKEKLNSDAVKWRKEQEEKFQQQKTSIEATAQKKASEELSVKLKSMEEEATLKNAQVKELQTKELGLLRDKAALEEKQKNIEIELEKRFLEKRKELEDSAIKRERELSDLKLKEKDLAMDSMKKTIDELNRKVEHGDNRLQGESQEVLLEEILKEYFPFDVIEEVGKGVEGADCIQVIRNNSGKECGKIIYESKRTKNWSNSWIDKLKADMRNSGADVAVLVTQVYPKDMERFGEKDGIWLCSFNEVGSIAHLLRNGIIKVYDIQKSQENRGDKMQMLYDYLTGNEFRGQIEAIVEGFVAMKQSIIKERIQMEKIWKEREKQLEKVLISTSGMYGSVKGIAGASVSDIPLLEGSDDETEDE